MSSTTEIEVVTSTLAEFDRVGAGLADLRAKYHGVVFAVTTAAGMKEAVAARAALRVPRLDVERLRKAAKAPLLEIGRKLDAEAKRITADIEALENPIDAQIQAELDRKEAEKAAKAAAELARLEKISAAIAEIAALPGRYARASSKEVGDVHDELEARALTTDVFQERHVEALNVKAQTLVELKALQRAAAEREAEAARIAAEREELAAHRAAEAKRQADEAARLAAEREALDRQRREQEAEALRVREQQAEADRIAREAVAAEQARIAAEAQRLADERAAFEKQQQDAAEAARKAAEPPAPTPAPAAAKNDEEALPFDAPKRPTAGELVDAIANEFGVNPLIAWDWLRSTNFHEPIELPLAA